MRRNEFVRYLTTPKDANDKPFAGRTAKEMASLCSSIEKEYGMDLDDALRDSAKESRLFDFADSIKRANPQKYQRALRNYKDFFHNTLSFLFHLYLCTFCNILLKYFLQYLSVTQKKFHYMIFQKTFLFLRLFICRIRYRVCRKSFPL